MRSPFPNWFLCLTLSLVGLGVLRAGSSAQPTLAQIRQGFDAANAAYERGQYTRAAQDYQNLLAHGQASAALYFNLGNAWFKAGHLGQAIVNYLRAERLAPRDPDIRANLTAAREAVTDTASHSGGWRVWLNRFSVNEWATVTGLCFWACFVLLVVSEFVAGRESLRRWAYWVGALTFLAAAATGWVWEANYGQDVAVVVHPESNLRYGPLDVSPRLQVLPDGQELVIVDHKNGWFQVQGAARGVGWIKETDVQPVGR